MNILKKTDFYDSNKLIAKTVADFDFTDTKFVSFMYCMVCKQLNLGGYEYNEDILRQVFTEEEFKRIGSIYIDIVKEHEPDEYEKLLKEGNKFELGEIIRSFCSSLKENSEHTVGLLVYSCSKKLENVFNKENPLADIQNSVFMSNFADTFNLNCFEVTFLLLNLFAFKNIWFLPEPLPIDMKVTICSRFYNGSSPLTESYINQINKKFIKLGLFSDDWKVADYVYSYFTGNTYPFKITYFLSNAYLDCYSIDSIATENYEDMSFAEKILSQCKRLGKGCYMTVSNADEFRSRNFLTFINRFYDLFTLEIISETSDFDKNAFIFFLVASSGQLQRHNGIFLLGSEIISNFFKDPSENHNTITIVSSSPEKEDKAPADIAYDLFQNINTPVLLLIDSQDSAIAKSLDENLKIVYKWDLKNPAQKEYDEQLSQYLKEQNIDEYLIEPIVTECKYLQIPTKKWSDLANLVSILKEPSPDELKMMITANFHSSDSKQEIRKNSHYSLDALRTTEPVEKIVKALQNAEKWQTDEYNSESGIRILNYGISGTGKTAFVEKAAKMLDKPLKIVRASDILGMYVGETEKNIKEAFEEAAESNSILLIDEADSFLHARGDKINRHNDSKVNEFLVQMERFPGILFCNTNLPDSLDSATDRRFHMKIGFKPLNKDGISLLCKSYFEKFEFTDQQINEIYNSGDVTPGDFGSLYGRIRFTDPEDVNPDFICSELIKLVKGKKRSWENNNPIGFCS